MKNKKKTGITVIIACVLLVAFFLLKPLYDSAIKEDHKNTCWRFRNTIWIFYEKAMQEYIKENDSPDEQDYENVLRDIMTNLWQDKYVGNLERVECDRSDAVCKFLIKDTCREGGTITIYVLDPLHYEISCDVKDHCDVINY